MDEMDGCKLAAVFGLHSLWPWAKFELHSLWPLAVAYVVSPLIVSFYR